ncbi:MAG: NUDIX domain-containing protein [Candidatus Latescibacteria bacterium]|nr:NUDIX domain-containing protein [Candidatus Latescibacterota bacterium]
MAAPFTVGCFALILDAQQRVLLCRRRDIDFWNMPGGGLETGEAPWEGAVREVREETGLEVAVEKLVGVYGKGPARDDLVFTFLCRVTGGHLTTTDEACEVGYFGRDYIPANTLAKHLERIADFFGDSDQPHLRVH